MKRKYLWLFINTGARQQVQNVGELVRECGLLGAT